MLQEHNPRTWIHHLFTWPVLLLLMQNCAAWASNDEFKARCVKLAVAAAVVVTFTDIATSENSSHTVESLKSLSGKTSDPHHNVYGLTHTEPIFSYEIKPRWLIGPAGRTCMVPDVSVKMGFSAMRIYLARELQDSCRKNIVRDHELQHVSAWKSHLRIGAKLLEEPLRLAFSQPRYYASTAQAQADLQPWVEGVLKPLHQRIMKSVTSAQRAIDSSISYTHVKNRLRNCPPSANGVL
ncbi:MAG: hypothetical protein H0U72_02170 [Nitrosospira sp.]|nr:hypothetical protein [Nitrosospira sp.]